MKRERLRHITIAWLLLICMLPLSVTKIVHRHGQQQTACCAAHHCETDPDHSDHSDDTPCTCLICKFTLSPYIVAEASPLITYTTIISCEPVCTDNPVYVEPIYSPLLRAPPVD